MSDNTILLQEISAKALPKKKQVIIVAVATLVVAVLLLGVFLTQLSAKASPVSDENNATPGIFYPTKSQLATLKIEALEKKNFRTERTTDGYIAANDDLTTQVFSPYSGQVTRLIAKPGDAVKKGSPLMMVMGTEFIQARSDLIAALGSLESSQVQLKQMQAAEHRQHELVLAGAGAEKDWQQSQTDLANAVANEHSAEITLTAVRDRLRILGKTNVEIEKMVHTFKAGQKNSVNLNAEVAVLAPISGTVVQRSVGVGQYITSGAGNPVYAISNQSVLWLLANVREDDVAQMHSGASVEARVPAYPNRVFKGQISWIAAGIDPNTHRLPVRAEIANPDGTLKPQMLASVVIVTGNASEAISVPETAVVFEGEEAHVFVARADGGLGIRKIVTGRRMEGDIEVVSGLEPGERVVTRGTLFIDRAAQGN